MINLLLQGALALLAPAPGGSPVAASPVPTTQSVSPDLVTEQKTLKITVDGKFIGIVWNMTELDPDFSDLSNSNIRPDAKICFETEKDSSCKIARKGEITEFLILYNKAVRRAQIKI